MWKTEIPVEHVNSLNGSIFILQNAFFTETRNNINNLQIHSSY